jgi:tetratricopeptide (TPR) repeat protein
MKAYDFLGDYKAAAELGEETISIYKKERGLDNEFAFSAIRDQSRIYLRLKEWQEAIRCSKIAVDISTKLSGEYSSKTTGVKQDLAITYQEAQNYETSLKVGLEVLKNLVLAFNTVNKAAVSEMLGACRFFSPSQGKEQYLDLFSKLGITKDLFLARFGKDKGCQEEIQNGLNQLYRRAPTEWQGVMALLV